MIKVLVVDNAKDWCDMLSGCFRDAGYSPHAVQTAEEALEALAEQLLHIAVVDFRLKSEDESDESGLELAQEIRKRFPNVRIIILTGHPVKSKQVLKAKEYGVFDYIEKREIGTPEGVQDLVQKVKEAYRTLQEFRCFMTGGKDCSRVIEVKANQVFVAMPYRSKGLSMKDVYELGIKSALEDLNYHPFRADDRFLGKALACDICKHIQESPLCIADITGGNANVFLELGMMYGRGKTVVLLKHKDSKVPADLGAMLYIEYEDIAGLKSDLVSKLPYLEY